MGYSGIIVYHTRYTKGYTIQRDTPREIHCTVVFVGYHMGYTMGWYRFPIRYSMWQSLVSEKSRGDQYYPMAAWDMVRWDIPRVSHSPTRNIPFLMEHLSWAISYVP